MNKIICCVMLALVLSFSMYLTASAKSLNLTTQNPTLKTNSTFVDYFEFGGVGDLSSFGNSIDFSDGVTPNGSTDFSFGLGFFLSDPTTGATGFFDVFDTNGQFLGGDLLAVGFAEDVIELQFNNLIGSAASNFDNSVLASINFDDPLGLNPFNGLIDGTFYTASISLSNVISPVPEPTMFKMLVLALFLIGLVQLKRNSTTRTLEG